MHVYFTTRSVTLLRYVSIELKELLTYLLRRPSKSVILTILGYLAFLAAYPMASQFTVVVVGWPFSSKS